MELSLREWLLLVGIVIIIGILIDGYRRMKLARKDSLEMNRRMSGGLDDMPADGSDEAGQLDLGGSVDGLGDPALTGKQTSGLVDLPDFGPATDSSDLELNDNSEGSFRSAERQVSTGFGGEPVGHSSTPLPVYEELMIVSVVSQGGPGFNGRKLRLLLEGCGLVFGAGNMFHRHDGQWGEGEKQFSVATMGEPGTFNLQEMDYQSYDGICLFLGLPGPVESLEAFDFMLETARCIARNFDGELRDQNGATLTGQMMEHCRQRIGDWQLRQQMAAQAS